MTVSSPRSRRRNFIFISGIAVALFLCLAAAGCVNSPAQPSPTVTPVTHPHDVPARNITSEEAVQIVLRDPAVISWINNSMNNTKFDVQQIDRMTIGGDRPGIPAEDRWVVPLHMYINNFSYHYTLEVGMNGTIMYRRYPRTLIPPPPDWTPPAG